MVLMQSQLIVEGFHTLRIEARGGPGIGIITIVEAVGVVAAAAVLVDVAVEDRTEIDIVTRVAVVAAEVEVPAAVPAGAVVLCGNEPEPEASARTGLGGDHMSRKSPHMQKGMAHQGVGVPLPLEVLLLPSLTLPLQYTNGEGEPRHLFDELGAGVAAIL